MARNWQSDYSGLEVATSDGIEIDVSTVAGLELVQPDDEKIACPGDQRSRRIKPTTKNFPSNCLPDKRYRGQYLVEADVRQQDGIAKGDASTNFTRRRRRRLMWLTLAALFVIVIVVVAIVVGVVVSQQKASSSLAVPPPSPAPSGSPPPTTSKSGAFNGTNVAVVDPGNGVDSLWLFYQDYTGDLRYIALTGSKWQNSNSLGVQNVANGTGLAAKNYLGADNSTLVRLTLVAKNLPLLKAPILTFFAPRHESPTPTPPELSAMPTVSPPPPPPTKP